MSVMCRKHQDMCSEMSYCFTSICINCHIMQESIADATHSCEGSMTGGPIHVPLASRPLVQLRRGSSLMQDTCSRNAGCRPDHFQLERVRVALSWLVTSSAFDWLDFLFLTTFIFIGGITPGLHDELTVTKSLSCQCRVRFMR